MKSTAYLAVKPGGYQKSDVLCTMGSYRGSSSETKRHFGTHSGRV